MSHSKFSFKFPASLLIIMISIGSYIAGQALVATILLTFYTPDILAYFYFGQPILTICLTLGFNYFEKKWPNNFFWIAKLIFVAVFLIAYFMLRLNQFYMPLVLATIIFSLITYIPVQSWNLVSQIYNVIELKEKNSQFFVAATFGTILSGICIYLIKENYLNILFIMLAAEMLSIILYSYLKTELIYKKPSKSSQIHNQEKTKLKLLKNPIIKGFFLYMFFYVIAYTFIDYSLKTSIYENIKKDQISHYMGNLYVISSVISLFIQIMFMQVIVNRAGSAKTIFIPSFLLGITAIFALISPNILLISALFIVADVLKGTFHTLSKNLYLQILSPTLNKLGRITLSGMVKPISVVFSSGLIWLLSNNQLLRINIIIIIISLIFCGYIAYKLTRKYVEYLKQSVYLKRFSPIVLSNSEPPLTIQSGYLKHALKEANDSSLLYLLQYCDNIDDRYAAAIIKKLFSSNELNCLLQLSNLLLEKDPCGNYLVEAYQAVLKIKAFETRWLFCAYLIKHQSAKLSELMNLLMQSNKIDDKVLAHLIKVKTADIDLLKDTLSFIKKLESSNEPVNQFYSLKLLSALPRVTDFDFIKKCIESNNPSLVRAALNLAPSELINDFLPLLTKKLVMNQNANIVVSYLSTCESKTLSKLMEIFHQQQAICAKRYLIMVFSQHQDPVNEQYMTECIEKEQNFLVKLLLLKYLAYRSIRMNVKESTRLFLTNMVAQDANSLSYLYQKHYSSNAIQAEIQSRCQLLKERILYTVAAIYHSFDLLNASLTILSTHTFSKEEIAKAVELADSLIRAPLIKKIVLLTFDIDKIKATDKNACIDPLLASIMNESTDSPIIQSETIVVLRKTALFSKLPLEVLQQISEIIEIVQVTEGDLLFNQNDAGDGLYVIAEGIIILQKDGEEISKLKAFDYFGELSVLSDRPRATNAIAQNDGRLLFISKQDFDRIADENPEILKTILKQVISYLPE